MVLRALVVRDAKRRHYRASNDTGSGGRQTRIDDVSYRMLYITRFTIMFAHTQKRVTLRSSGGVENKRSGRTRPDTDASPPAVRVKKSFRSSSRAWVVGASAMSWANAIEVLGRRWRGD
jgi:hypothetical protein